MNYSPIVIFAHNRPKHLNNLIKSLEKNKESTNSTLFIYIDKNKDKENENLNKEVVEVSNKNWNFHKVEVILREENLGLKNNILSGITEVLNKHKKIIVLEEDLVVSETFLNYMNLALNKYEEEKNVWHISGYSLDTLLNNNKGTYFTQEMYCWGWATWIDRWENLDRNLENKLHESDQKIIKRFNFYGLNKNNHNQLILNDESIIKTWAIYWYQYIFLNDGLCLNPSKSLVKNMGFDGSGEHNSTNRFYKINKLNQSSSFNFQNKLSKSKVYELFISIKYIKKNVKEYFSYHLSKLKKVHK